MCNSYSFSEQLSFCENYLNCLGATVDIVSGNDENSDLPPVLFGSIWVNDEYKTVCVYGNIGLKINGILSFILYQ